MIPPIPPGTRLLGITGAPGAGKSTLAAALHDRLGLPVVPMDGFHYADVELERRGLRDRKGAPETFDAPGYAALLRRVRAGEDDLVAPAFERDLEQPLAGALWVPPTGTVVTEGNYLLLDEPRWRAVRAELDLVWHLVTDDAVRRERLVARHVEFGKTRDEARAWVARVDDANAALVEAAAPRADLVIDLGSVDLGSVDLGSVDLGSVDLGSVDLGSVDLGG
ncbi:nucleoside/nucleotide kinase family protein [Nocardioides sp.]|uniref:nucleoside/nucleotide kinase family protein n=1 Tax=Nocardioides sp. TaxID=35761 RepID=UPI0037840620